MKVGTCNTGIHGFQNAKTTCCFSNNKTNFEPIKGYIWNNLNCANALPDRHSTTFISASSV